MSTPLKGEVNFSENYNKWILKVNVKWTKRWTQIKIDSRKTDLQDDFVNCSLTKAQFFTFLSRSETYNFKGTKSNYSELLLESVEAQCLMDSKNPKLKLDEKSLIFEGGIRKKDQKSLSNVFILFETLMDDIDYLHAKRITK